MRRERESEQREKGAVSGFVLGVVRQWSEGRSGGSVLGVCRRWSEGRGGAVGVCIVSGLFLGEERESEQREKARRERQ